MLLVAVHAAVAQEPKEVKPARTGFGCSERVHERFLLGERAVLHREIDADEILVIYRAGADREMAHLRVAH